MSCLSKREICNWWVGGSGWGVIFCLFLIKDLFSFVQLVTYSISRVRLLVCNQDNNVLTSFFQDNNNNKITKAYSKNMKPQQEET